MKRQEPVNALVKFIDDWINAKGTTWTWLMGRAGIAQGTGTGLRSGSTPQPETIRKLAAAMGVSRARLFLLAGYLEDNDLQSEQALSGDESELMQMYRGLSPRYRNALLATAQALLRSGGDSGEFLVVEP